MLSKNSRSFEINSHNLSMHSAVHMPLSMIYRVLWLALWAQMKEIIITSNMYE